MDLIVYELENLVQLGYSQMHKWLILIMHHECYSPLKMFSLKYMKIQNNTSSTWISGKPT